MTNGGRRYDLSPDDGRKRSRHDHPTELDPEAGDQEGKRTGRQRTPSAATPRGEHASDLVDEAQVTFAAEGRPAFEPQARSLAIGTPEVRRQTEPGDDAIGDAHPGPQRRAPACEEIVRRPSCQALVGSALVHY